MRDSAGFRWRRCVVPSTRSSALALTNFWTPDYIQSNVYSTARVRLELWLNTNHIKLLYTLTQPHKLQHTLTQPFNYYSKPQLNQFKINLK